MLLRGGFCFDYWAQMEQETTGMHIKAHRLCLTEALLHAVPTESETQLVSKLQAATLARQRHVRDIWVVCKVDNTLCQCCHTRWRDAKPSKTQTPGSGTTIGTFRLGGLIQTSLGGFKFGPGMIRLVAIQQIQSLSGKRP